MKMRVTYWTRIKGSSCLLALLVSASFTNCTCGPAKNNNPPVTVDPSKGDTTAVAGCNSLNFVHYTGDPMLCQGSGSALPGAPVGWQLPIVENQMRKCPDDGVSVPSTTPFMVYWTVTNVTDTVLTDAAVSTYKMIVSQINSNGTETAKIQFDLTQPKVASCEFQDIAFAFNNGNAARALAPGKYAFRLTDIYNEQNGWLATASQIVTITQ